VQASGATPLCCTGIWQGYGVRWLARGVRFDCGPDFGAGGGFRGSKRSIPNPSASGWTRMLGLFDFLHIPGILFLLHLLMSQFLRVGCKGRIQNVLPPLSIQ